MRCFRTRNLLLSKKCVPLHCVFHSIRFKVNKGWSTAVLLFLCLYLISSILKYSFHSYLIYIPYSYAAWLCYIIESICNRYEKVCNTSINTCSAMMQMYSRGLDKFAEIKKEMI
jgi:cell shape-determining protein MreC